MKNTRKMETIEELELGVLKAEQMLNDIKKFWTTSEQRSSVPTLTHPVKIEVDDNGREVDEGNDGGDIDFWRKELSISMERMVTALTALRLLGHDLKKRSEGKSQILKRYTYKKMS